MTRAGPENFVGRRAELETLIAAAIGDGGETTTWLIGGEAGIGKTRLVDEFTRRLDPDRVAAAVGGCIHTAHGSLPFVAITEALRSLCARYEPGDVEAASNDLPKLGLLIPDFVSHTPEQVAEAAADESQLRLFDAVASLLARLGEVRRVCLVLEDLHWADTSTRELFVFLAQNLDPSRAALVGTYRSDELSRTHPFRPVLVELDRSHKVVHLLLEPFDEAELASYAVAVLDYVPDANVVDELTQRSGGNAFYASEILAAITAGRHSVRPELSDLILARIECLTDPTQDLMRLVAVGGESVRDELLERVAELPEKELLTSLREAIDHQVLTVTDDGPLRFRHALMQEAVYATLLPRERQRAHARYADALRQVPHLAARPESCNAELAWHLKEARDFDEALAASVDAARASEALLAFPEAVGHVETALELWDHADDPADLAGMSRADLLRWAADLAEAGGKFPRAVRFERTAIDEAEAEDRDVVELALLHARLGRHLQTAGHGVESLVEFRRAVELVPPDPPSRERAMVLAGLGQQLMLVLDIDAARAALTEAVEIARATGARQTEGHALNSLGSILQNNGRRTEGTAMLLEALNIATDENVATDMLRAYVNLVDGFQGTGELPVAERFGREGMTLARELGHERGHGFFIAANLAEVLTEMGRWDEALEMVSTVKRPEGGLPREWMFHPLVDVPLRRGDFEAARLALESTAPDGTYVQDAQILPAYWLRRADLALAQGDLDACREAVHEGLTSARILHHMLAIRVTAIRLETAGMEAGGEPASAHQAADSLLAEMEALVETNLEPGDHESHRIWALLSEARAEVAGSHGEDSTELWLEAADQWGRGELSWHRGCALARLGEALLQRGDREGAAAALEESAEIARRLGATPLRDRVTRLVQQSGLHHDGGDGSTDAGVLTPRELGVLELLAEGKTNRQIGEALFISPKTVSVHVSRILQKLDVENRTEAAAAGRRAGLV